MEGEDRKARLRRLREEAAAAGQAEGDGPSTAAADEQQQQPAGEPPQLKFRNYVPKDEKINHEKVAPAKVQEFEEVKVDVDEALGVADGEDALISVAPRKANWDLRRDIAPQLAKLDRRTQAAMIKLMQQEEQRRLAEEGGMADEA